LKKKLEEKKGDEKNNTDLKKAKVESLYSGERQSGGTGANRWMGDQRRGAENGCRVIRKRSAYTRFTLETWGEKTKGE